MFFEENNGNIILRDEDFDLKITSDRKLYIRRQGIEKFNILTQTIIPKHYTHQMKKEVLINLNNKVKEKHKYYREDENGEV